MRLLERRTQRERVMANICSLDEQKAKSPVERTECSGQNLVQRIEPSALETSESNPVTECSGESIVQWWLLNDALVDLLRISCIVVS